MRTEISLCVLCFAACASAPSLVPMSDDAAVYVAALDSLAVPGTPLVVLDSTITIPSNAPLLTTAQRMGADSAMRAGLIAWQSVAVPRLSTPRRVHYAHTRDLVGDNRDRVAFLAQHGARGYYRVSGIGYSSDRQRALLYVTHWCGSLCGESWLVMAVERPEGWRVEAVQLTMIA